MADNVSITAGTGTSIGADEVTDATLGTVKVQYVKIMDGTLDGTTKAAVGANGVASDVKAIVPGTAASNLGKAEDAGHSSGDVGVMALAVRVDTLAATAANGDYHPLLVDANGALWVSLGTKLDGANDSVSPFALPSSYIYGATAKIEDTNAAALFASAGGSLRNYVTSLVVTNSDATVGTVVEIRDGTVTVMFRGYAAPAGGGFAIAFPTPLRGSAATAVNVYCITTSSEVYVSATGYTAL
jgi:hypothetical protein